LGAHRPHAHFDGITQNDLRKPLRLRLTTLIPRQLLHLKAALDHQNMYLVASFINKLYPAILHVQFDGSE
jgi:hypothetical protein